MSILVTGSNGQVGRAIKMHSAKSHFTFDFTDRNSLDIADKEAVFAYILGLKPKIIINTAAYTAVDKAEEEEGNCYAINADALGYIAQANNQLEEPAFIIHISTDYVYHSDHELIMDENESTNPQSVYAKSKLKGELLLKEYAENFLVLRTSWVYDEDGKNFVNTMDRLGSQRAELNVVSDQIGSPTYAGDIAKVILDIVDKINQGEQDKLAGKTFNFSNEGFTNWSEFAVEIMRIKNHNCAIHPILTSEYPTAAKRPLNSRMDKSLIKKTLGIDIPNWKDSLSYCLKEK